MINLAEKDARAIYIGNLNTVEESLQLPAEGSQGSKITWHSEEPRFLEDDGTVHRPKFGLGSRDIRLTAIVDDGTNVVERVFLVHVLEAENDIQVTQVFPVQVNQEEGKPLHLPSSVPVETADHDIIAHEVEWKTTEEGVLKGTNIPVYAQIHRIAAATPQKPEPVCREAPLSEVRLLPSSPFYDMQERNLQFLLSVDDDQMLYNFRDAAGLSTQGAKPMIGWDAPECRLKGHTTGHYLSALALCYAATGDKRILQKAIYMTQELKKCQDAFQEIPGIRPGFLSGYSEEQFDLLETFTRYPKIWAPYYTLHKILAGLLDLEEYANLQASGEIARKLGLWVYNRLNRLPEEQRARMWSLYIAGEYGGLNESMAELNLRTGDDRYLTAARFFDNDKLFYSCEQGMDALSGMHANQHIPQAIGALKLYAATGEERYRKIAENFWEFVTQDHIYAIGGTGEGEMFRRAGWISRTLSDSTAESCASYNMLKLSEALFAMRPQERYMDYYERTVTNHILSTSEHKPEGRTTYFMPLKAGARKEFDEENSCCHGTGLESPSKLSKAIYWEDADSIYVNLFIPSTWETRGIRQEVKFLEDRMEITSSLHKPLEKDLKVRIPGWVSDEGYRIYQRPTDTIHLSFPLQLRIEPAPDNPNLGVLFWGPVLLAAIWHGEEIYLPELNRIRKTPGKLHFTYNETTFLPLYEIEEEAYQVYMHL